MSLRTNLYGTYNYQVPTRDELKHSGIIVDRNQQNKMRRLNIYLSLYNIVTNGARGKWKQDYITIINDYNNYCGYNTKSWTNIANLTYARYLYYNKYPEQYNNNFSLYATVFYNSILFQMRKGILRQKVILNEVPQKLNFNSRSSTFYYPMYKPLEEKHTISLAYKVYDLYCSLE